MKNSEAAVPAKKVYIKTFGCQMNEHDSEIMLGLMKNKGYRPTHRMYEADVVVINTCSIREKSHQKAFSTIGLLKERREVTVAVTGCVASQEGDKLHKRFPFIDFVLGPDHVQKLPELVNVRVQNPSTQTTFHDLSDYEFPTVVNQETCVKSYVTIMKGCDNVCSFCIVPMVRGQEVSREPAEILEEILLLEQQGVKEIILLGQNVNSYGRNTKTHFPQLLRRIEQKTSVGRIRYTSPHPQNLSVDLMRLHGESEKLCPQIHLPVQAGSNRVLKKMRRSYSREVYLRKVDQLRQIRPDIAISTDIIVGFPGETEADFQETLSLVQEVGFDASYSFAFSPRPGTEASQWSDDVPNLVKKERLYRLQQLQEELSWKKNKILIGESFEVLVEGESGWEGPMARGQFARGQLTGRTPHGRIVNFYGAASLVGATIDVEITEVSPYSLKGVL